MNLKWEICFRHDWLLTKQFFLVTKKPSLPDRKTNLSSNSQCNFCWPNHVSTKAQHCGSTCICSHWPILVFNKWWLRIKKNQMKLGPRLSIQPASRKSSKICFCVWSARSPCCWKASWTNCAHSRKCPYGVGIKCGVIKEGYNPYIIHISSI